MKPKSSIIIPTYDSTIAVTAKNEYDIAHSDIFNSLSYDDIIGYFGSKEEVINYYKETLDSGYPRSAAFLMVKIIEGSIVLDGQDVAKGVLLEDLSMLSDDNMGTGADILISKIAKPSIKKKIMFCSGHWLTGGMERVMSVLFNELKNDYEIYLITPYDERHSHIDLPDFITSIKIDNELFVKHFDSLILSYALLLDIDAVIGVMNMFPKQLSFYNICAGTKIKTIASNHEYYFYPYKSPGHYPVVEKRLSAFTKCDAIIWPLNFNAAVCGLYVDNNYVIGNPNSSDFTSDSLERSSEKIVLCVGRFNDYVKRIDRILECFSVILKKVPDAKLILVGKYDNHVPIKPNDRTTVNDLINKFAIPPESINFIGEVNNVQDYYSRANVLLLTSNNEGFGMVVNEAAQFGVPSVCNFIPGIEDLITDGENGFIVEQDDINTMASKVCDILTNDKLKEKLGTNARRKVKAYDAKIIGDKWRFLIQSLIEIKDEDELRQKLESKLKYEIKNINLFTEVLAKELNEIFYLSLENNVQHSRINLILSKVAKTRNRFRANIEYEGFFKTVTKVATRSYRILRIKLQKNQK